MRNSCITKLPRQEGRCPEENSPFFRSEVHLKICPSIATNIKATALKFEASRAQRKNGNFANNGYKKCNFSCIGRTIRNAIRAGAEVEKLFFNQRFSKPRLRPFHRRAIVVHPALEVGKFPA